MANSQNLERLLLGFAIYYHKFVKIYGQIVEPITTLLNKEALSFTKEETESFEKLNEAMCTTHVPVAPDFIKTFIVECDASSHGIGVVLMQ
jgi:hypothetical protein